MKAKVEYTCAFCHQHNCVSEEVLNEKQLNELSLKLKDFRQTAMYSEKEDLKKRGKNLSLPEIKDRCSNCRKRQAWSNKPVSILFGIMCGIAFLCFAALFLVGMFSIWGAAVCFFAFVFMISLSFNVGTRLTIRRVFAIHERLQDDSLSIENLPILVEEDDNTPR